MNSRPLSSILKRRMLIATTIILLCNASIAIWAGYSLVVKGLTNDIKVQNRELQSVLSNALWTLNRDLAEGFISHLSQTNLFGRIEIIEAESEKLWLAAGEQIAEEEVFSEQLVPLFHLNQIIGYVSIQYSNHSVSSLTLKVSLYALVQLLILSMLLVFARKIIFSVYLDKPVALLAKHSNRLLNVLRGRERAFVENQQRTTLKQDLQDFLSYTDYPDQGVDEWTAIVASERSLVESLIIAINEVDKFLVQLEEVNNNLYSRVNSRNAELVKRGKELADIMDKLQYSQSLIVHQEKMASVGQLAAGIAHEINNPNGFIVSNLTTLKGYFDEIVEAFGKQDGKSEDLEFVLQDGVELIDDCLDGTQRIKEIVSSLKDYARGEQKTDVQKFDPKQSIEAAMRITNNETKYFAEVRFIENEHSMVFGSSGKLTQVLCNLLVNAAHAIQELESKELGTIDLTLADVAGKVEIRVADSGPGMSEATKNKAFEPFFTTKAVGKGTGLGLHIAFDIIDTQFRGSIHLNDRAPSGLEVVIRLPISEN